MKHENTATDAKKADKATLGAEKPKSLADNQVSAERMLDPADHEVTEADAVQKAPFPQGNSYPSAEAVAESERLKEKEKEKVSEEMLKKSGIHETRSALDPNQPAIVHPDAVEKK